MIEKTVETKIGPCIISIRADRTLYMIFDGVLINGINYVARFTVKPTVQNDFTWRVSDSSIHRQNDFFGVVTDAARRELHILAEAVVPLQVSEPNYFQAVTAEIISDIGKLETDLSDNIKAKGRILNQLEIKRGNLEARQY